MQPLEDPGGRRLVWSVSYDFTEEHDTEQALIEASERLRSLAANMPGAIFQLARTKEGRLKYPYMGRAMASEHPHIAGRMPRRHAIT